MVNEDVVGPKINPVKERYWKQFGGGPDAALREQMDGANAERFYQDRQRNKKK